MLQPRPLLLVVFLLGLASTIVPGARAQFVQQGSKLIGSGAFGAPGQGSSVAISADGNTAIVGGSGDTGGFGAAWVFARVNAAQGATWNQQGPKLAGTGAIGTHPLQGSSVAISADGNTAIVGGPDDDNGVGAAWVFTRNSAVSGAPWSQQGGKLSGSGALPDSAGFVYQGYSVALSADGNTAILGAPLDNGGLGAAWIFTRANGAWTQQGAKLTGSGALFTPASPVSQGASVGLSADGNTAIIGGPLDNGGFGAAWIFTRGNAAQAPWTQQGAKLTGSGASGTFPEQGSSVALSADGNTAILGAPFDNAGAGALWVFTRNTAAPGTPWTQQGGKLVGSGAVDAGYLFGIRQGNSVALSADGNTAIAGGDNDNGGIGAVWAFRRANGVWNQLGGKLAGTGAAGTAQQGFSVALSADAATLIAGAPGDIPLGAARIFTRQAVPGATAPVGVSPGSGSSSSQVMTFVFTDPRGYQDLDVLNVLVNNFLDGRNACYLAYSRRRGRALPGQRSRHCAAAGPRAQRVRQHRQQPVSVAGASSSATGNGNTFTLTLNLSFGARFRWQQSDLPRGARSPGRQLGLAGAGNLGSARRLDVPVRWGREPGGARAGCEIFNFTFTDTKGYQDLGVVNVLINNSRRPPGLLPRIQPAYSTSCTW